MVGRGYETIVIHFLGRQQMFSKTMARGLMTVALAATLLGGRAMADVILPTQAQLSALGATEYQIAFVTTDTTSGTSGLESTYNNIASTDAAEDGILNGLGVTWTAITSTIAGSTYTDASTNAPTYAGVPIFNTAGQLVLADGESLYAYTSTLQDPIKYNQYGAPVPPPDFVLTGGFAGGPHAGPLGENFATTGDFTSTSLTWNTYVSLPYGHMAPVYALSSVIPEPGTLTLLSTALLGLGAFYLRRRRAKAS
jgi:hypothetical protein